MMVKCRNCGNYVTARPCQKCILLEYLCPYCNYDFGCKCKEER